MRASNTNKLAELPATSNRNTNCDCIKHLARLLPWPAPPRSRRDDVSSSCGTVTGGGRVTDQSLSTDMAYGVTATRSSRWPSYAPSLDTDDDVINRPMLRLQTPSPACTPGNRFEEPPRRRRPGCRSRPVRLFQSLCRLLPVLTPRCGRFKIGPCQLPAPGHLASGGSVSHAIPFSASGGSRRHVTGTLFGYHKGHIAFSLQETPQCLPSLVVELALPTHALLRELGTTAGVRIVLEREKRAAAGGGGRTKRRDQGSLLEEPMWTMFCNGRRVGYAARREASEDDLAVMETLWAVSMGGGVLPGKSDVEGPDGEMAYMRGCFEHTASRDSESLYMVGPRGGHGPELAIFFVRL